MSYRTFIPPKRTLLGPGPSDIHPRVLEAMSRGTIGHLDPEFVTMMDEIKDLLRYAFVTKNEVTFPVSGPGTVGMETCLVNLIEPGDKVVICVNGAFGGRMKAIAERCGAEVITVDDDWGKPVDPEKLKQALKSNPDAGLVGFVHAETSTGALSDAKTLSDIARNHDCLVVADTVTSLGGIPVEIDAWGADAVYSGTQKCLSCPPGLSPVSFSDRAVQFIQNRTTKVQSWFMDLNLVLGYWSGSKRSYHHTAPINALYGLHEALLLLKEEGLENAWKRHTANSELFVEGLQTLGLETLVKGKERLPQLITVKIPDGVDEAGVRSSLLHDYNIEIGAGLGSLAGKIWRIGLMGYSSDENKVNYCLRALKEILSR